MADNRSMAQMLGSTQPRVTRDSDSYSGITANNFEIQHGLLNLVQINNFLEMIRRPTCSHRYFNKSTYTLEVPNVQIRRLNLCFSRFSLEGKPGYGWKNEPHRSIENGMILIASNRKHSTIPSISIDQDSLNSAAGGRCSQFSPSYFWLSTSVGLKSIRPPGFPLIQNPHANNQNNFNRGNNFNQNRGNNFNQGQIYRPPVNQPVAHQGPAPQTHASTSVLNFLVHCYKPKGRFESLVIQIRSNVAPLLLLMFILQFPKAINSISSRRKDERRKKSYVQFGKFYEIFRDFEFEIDFTDALDAMLKFASTLKTKVTKSCPVIIAKDLKDEEKAALLKVLKSHKRAIAWKLSDIKGVNPEFCTHKILMEEDYKLSVQSQRRVNPKIHDVIKKEVEDD
ncbi:hypothetical protein Tco_1021684 [Tanacetum coccineum]